MLKWIRNLFMQCSGKLSNNWKKNNEDGGHNLNMTISFGVPLIFSLSRKPNIGLYGVLSKELLSFLWTTINLASFLFMVPLDRTFFWGVPLMGTICWCFPLLAHLYLSLAPLTISLDIHNLGMGLVLRRPFPIYFVNRPLFRLRPLAGCIRWWCGHSIVSC